MPQYPTVYRVNLTYSYYNVNNKKVNTFIRFSQKK